MYFSNDNVECKQSVSNDKMDCVNLKCTYCQSIELGKMISARRKAKLLRGVRMNMEVERVMWWAVCEQMLSCLVPAWVAWFGVWWLTGIWNCCRRRSSGWLLGRRKPLCRIQGRRTGSLLGRSRRCQTHGKCYGCRSAQTEMDRSVIIEWRSILIFGISNHSQWETNV